MNTLILFWNPTISNYKLENLHNALQDDCHVGDWAVWDYTKTHRGDRFFWVRCGEGNTGICMSGYFRSEPYLDEDWSGKGREVHYAKLLADVVIDPEQCPILTTAELQELIPSFDWTGGHSGRLLPEADAQKLEACWKQFLEENKAIFEKNAFRNDIDIYEIDWNWYDEEDEEDDDYDQGVVYAGLSFTDKGEFELSAWEDDVDDKQFEVSSFNLEKAKAELEQHYFKDGKYHSVKYSYWCVDDYPLFEKAALLAMNKHHSQVDKGGKPYNGHLNRVTLRSPGGLHKYVAMLHDLIEDTDVTANELIKLGFPIEVVNAVQTMTHRKSEKYEDYIKRVADNPLARAVKICDLEDAMDLRHLPEITPEDTERLATCQRAWRYLKEKANNSKP